MVLGLDADNKKKLVVVASGRCGLDKWVKHLTEDAAVWVGLRVLSVEAAIKQPKLVAITWSPRTAPLKVKVAARNVQGPMLKWFEGAACEFETDTLDDVTEPAIAKRISQARGSHQPSGGYLFGTGAWWGRGGGGGGGAPARAAPWRRVREGLGARERWWAHTHTTPTPLVGRGARVTRTPWRTEEPAPRTRALGAPPATPLLGADTPRRHHHPPPLPLPATRLPAPAPPQATPTTWRTTSWRCSRPRRPRGRPSWTGWPG